MDYKGYECPVCHEQFQDGEDIVVCPECGTPHHRACYEENGACANAQRRTKSSVSVKSAPVSPGKPTMRSVVMAQWGKWRRSVSHAAKKSAVS